ncbi:MAG: crosslink repair DNA glycosylase YcaQ family protein [Thermoplasmata archaeon]
MTRTPLRASLESARRLSVTKQRLAGPLPARITPSRILSVVRDLAYVQWDPISVVAPSHILSFWARLGDFRLADLERLLWEDKKLFEHWTPIASIVLSEDYPLYHSLMSRYPDSLSASWGNHRTRTQKFLVDRAGLRKKMLSELRKGPLQIGQFADHQRGRRSEGDWSSGSDVQEMLFHLLMRGEVMVVGHSGNQNIWGLSEDFLPSWVDRRQLPEVDVDRQAAERALRALGTATPSEIRFYYVRGRYQHLDRTLARLEEDSVIHPVIVDGVRDREVRYVHNRDLSMLESIGTDGWEPRLSLIPPFDNMVYNQARGNRLFGFDYIREQFLPKEKRKFGTYVLPIVWGERFIGRIDARLDKQKGELVINAVHAERDAPADREVGVRIEETIDRLAAFVGAKRVTYTSRVPTPWRSALR